MGGETCRSVWMWVKTQEVNNSGTLESSWNWAYSLDPAVLSLHNQLGLLREILPEEPSCLEEA